VPKERKMMNKGITSNRPKGFLLFLMLIHIGHKSGQPRQVALEVVRHDVDTSAYFVAAGWQGGLV
jgi:hypothetical protein